MGIIESLWFQGPSRSIDILSFHFPPHIYVPNLCALWWPGWVSVTSVFQVMILLCNQQSFICTHVDYCHPHCYLHHSRSCARLVRAIKLLYGDTVDSLRESNNNSNVALRGKKQKEVSEGSVSITICQFQGKWCSNNPLSRNKSFRPLQFYHRLQVSLILSKGRRWGQERQMIGLHVREQTWNRFQGFVLFPWVTMNAWGQW